MAKRYRDVIEEYCEGNGIAIPVGFHRRSANRYAVIEIDKSPPKLVARTWFAMADVVYHITSTMKEAESPDEIAVRIRILDFKEGVELRYTGGSRLKRGDSFA